MPVTGHSSRRWFVGSLAAVTLRAALHAEDAPTLKLLTNLAAKLSNGNLPGALEAFSTSLPGYQELVANLGAMTDQYEMICVIEIRDETGDEALRTADTEWFLQIKSKQDNGPTERRNVLVKITAARAKGKWRITSMEPRSVLAPPQIR